MEEIKKKYITNRYENDKFIKLFFEKFSKERNKIFQYIYDLLEITNNFEDENLLIQNIIKSDTNNNIEKISKIKNIKL
jgi:hypothetical protein